MESMLHLGEDKRYCLSWRTGARENANSLTDILSNAPTLNFSALKTAGQCLAGSLFSTTRVKSSFRDYIVLMQSERLIETEFDVRYVDVDVPTLISFEYMWSPTPPFDLPSSTSTALPSFMLDTKISLSPQPRWRMSTLQWCLSFCSSSSASAKVTLADLMKRISRITLFWFMNCWTVGGGRGGDLWIDCARNLGLWISSKFGVWNSQNVHHNGRGYVWTHAGLIHSPFNNWFAYRRRNLQRSPFRLQEPHHGAVLIWSTVAMKHSLTWLNPWICSWAQKVAACDVLIVLGTVLKSDVSGQIVMRAYLSGMPECKFGLNDKVLNSTLDAGADAAASASTSSDSGGKKRVGAVELDDVQFHQCVKLGKFDVDRWVAVWRCEF